MQTEPPIYKAILYAVLFPGGVGVVIPLILALIDPGDYGIVFLSYLGVPFLLVGPALLSYCVYLFWKKGFGTLTPWDAPKQIVTADIYGYCRNPMYVGVWLTIFGWSLLLNSPFTLLWLLFVLLAMNAFVVLHEEPALEQKHGKTWLEYKQKVPRRFIF